MHNLEMFHRSNSGKQEKKPLNLGMTFRPKIPGEPDFDNIDQVVLAECWLLQHNSNRKFWCKDRANFKPLVDVDRFVHRDSLAKIVFSDFQSKCCKLIYCSCGKRKNKHWFGIKLFEWFHSCWAYQFLEFSPLGMLASTFLHGHRCRICVLIKSTFLGTFQQISVIQQTPLDHLDRNPARSIMKFDRKLQVAWKSWTFRMIFHRSVCSTVDGNVFSSSMNPIRCCTLLSTRRHPSAVRRPTAHKLCCLEILIWKKD